MLTAAPASQNRQPVFLLVALLLSQLLSVAQADTAQSQAAPDGTTASADTHIKKDTTQQRTAENVSRGFDAIGARLYGAYLRARRDNPEMKGKAVVTLTIDIDGSVSSCTATTDELNDANFLGRICIIVKGFNFGTDGNAPWTGKHVIAFLPGG